MSYTRKLASQHVNANETITKAVAEATRVAIQAMAAAAQQKGHKAHVETQDEVDLQ